jgi:hypothetical protein
MFSSFSPMLVTSLWAQMMRLTVGSWSPQRWGRFTRRLRARSRIGKPRYAYASRARAKKKRKAVIGSHPR